MRGRRNESKQWETETETTGIGGGRSEYKGMLWLSGCEYRRKNNDLGDEYANGVMPKSLRTGLHALCARSVKTDQEGQQLTRKLLRTEINQTEPRLTGLDAADHLIPSGHQVISFQTPSSTWTNQTTMTASRNGKVEGKWREKPRIPLSLRSSSTEGTSEKLGSVHKRIRRQRGVGTDFAFCSQTDKAHTGGGRKPSTRAELRGEILGRVKREIVSWFNQAVGAHERLAAGWETRYLATATTGK